jgi:hypothetical protein
MSNRQGEFDLTNTRIALSKAEICSRSCRQATSMGRTIGATSEKNLPIKSQAPHRAWQQTKSLEHSSDVVGQSGRHADALRPRGGKRTRTVAVERLYVNRPEPAGASELSHSLRVVLIRLIDLHLRAARACRASRQMTSSPRARSSCTSQGVFAPVSMPMRKSCPAYRRTIAAICSGAVSHSPPPQSATSIVDDANGCHLLRNVQTDEVGHHD